jgi:hypothetical protein
MRNQKNEPKNKQTKNNIPVLRAHRYELFVGSSNDHHRSEIFLMIAVSNHGGKVRIKLV